MPSARFHSLSELLMNLRGEPLRQGENAYLLVDGLRVGRLSDFLEKRPSNAWVSLFNVSPGSPLFDPSPALIQIGENDERALRVLLRAKYRQSAQLLLSYQPLKLLAQQLSNQLYVEEEDGTRWALAFWDPFVMASLTGMQPPLNLLVPGPILEGPQISALLQSVTHLVLQNRDGEPQCVEVPARSTAAEAKIVLNQAQMDMLTDLDMPDRIAAILKKAEPGHPIGDAELHRLCCDAILAARSCDKHGFEDYCGIAFDALSTLDSIEETQE